MSQPILALFEYVSITDWYTGNESKPIPKVKFKNGFRAGTRPAIELERWIEGGCVGKLRVVFYNENCPNSDFRVRMLAELQKLGISVVVGNDSRDGSAIGWYCEAVK